MLTPQCATPSSQAKATPPNSPTSSSPAAKRSRLMMNSGAAAAASSPHKNKPGVQSLGGARKLVIKNWKASPKPPGALPDQFEARALASLQDSVTAIQNSRSISSSLEELYQYVLNLCDHNKAEQVHTCIHSSRRKDYLTNPLCSRFIQRCAARSTRTSGPRSNLSWART